MVKKRKAGAFTHDTERNRLYCDRDFVEEMRVDILAVSGLLELLYLTTEGGLWSQVATDEVSLTILRARDKLREIEGSFQRN